MNDAELGRAIRERRLKLVRIDPEMLVAFIRDGLEHGKAVRVIQNALPKDARVLSIRECMPPIGNYEFRAVVAHSDFEAVEEGSVIQEHEAATIETRHVPSGPIPYDVASDLFGFEKRVGAEGADILAIVKEVDKYLVSLLTELGYGAAMKIYDRL